MPGDLAEKERCLWGHTINHVRSTVVAQGCTDNDMVGATGTWQCNGKGKLGMYSFRTIEGTTAEWWGDDDTSVDSLPVSGGAQ